MSNRPWFICCNTQTISYDRWQDIDPKAYNTAQHQIAMMTGNILQNNKQANILLEHKNTKSIQNIHISTQGSIEEKHKINSINKFQNSNMEDSIIYRKFDDLISPRSFTEYSVKNNLISQTSIKQLNNQQPNKNNQFQAFYHSIPPKNKNNFYFRT